QHMSQVRSAVRAAHLSALHAERVVLDKANRIGADRFVETRPAASGIEFGAALEQFGAACTTGVEAGALLIEQLAGPGALGGRFAQHRVLVAAEFCTPLVVCLLHAVIHRSSRVSSILLLL